MTPDSVNDDDGRKISRGVIYVRLVWNRSLDFYLLALRSSAVEIGQSNADFGARPDGLHCLTE